MRTRAPGGRLRNEARPERARPTGRYGGTEARPGRASPDGNGIEENAGSASARQRARAKGTAREPAREVEGEAAARQGVRQHGDATPWTTVSRSGDRNGRETSTAPATVRRRAPSWAPTQSAPLAPGTPPGPHRPRRHGRSQGTGVEEERPGQSAGTCRARGVDFHDGHSSTSSLKGRRDAASAADRAGSVTGVGAASAAMLWEAVRISPCLCASV